MEDIKNLVKETRTVFNSGRTRSIEWRKDQLRCLLKMLDDNLPEISKALDDDLRKPVLEGKVAEFYIARNDCIGAIDNLEKWSAPEKVSRDLLTMQDGLYIRSEPYGLALVISAWNYPLQLSILPLIGAIAAGNCCILKPSEVAPSTAALLERLIPHYLDKECFPVVNGGIPETQALLAEKFDYIFYTGNSTVAKVIYQAATKYLTPCTLELGGKCPVYIDDNSDMELVARRLTWGKFMNCGQTCIAPDYVLCSKAIQDKLVESMKKYIAEFYGSNPMDSKDYGRIVNNRHFNRVKNLLQKSRVVVGGDSDESQSFIAPTVMANVTQTDPIMQDEIFGPVLAVMPVNGPDEAINIINGREKPLALYIFSKDNKVVDKFINSTSSGGVTVNDTLMHCGVLNMPFGGVGSSGMGGYHGKFSFDTFSHKRSVMHRKQGMEVLNNLRCPPYTARKEKILASVLNKSPKGGSFFSIASVLKIVVFGLILGVIAKRLGLEAYIPKSLKE